jgi:hypothetical protein
LDTILTATLMVCVIVILAESARVWLRVFRGERLVFEPALAGPAHTHIPGSGCC